MRSKAFVWVAGLLISACAVSRADFKYTVSLQVTGPLSSRPAPAGASAGGPEESTMTTTYVKGAFLRIDLPDGTYVIGDLKERRETWVNPGARTYSVLNYDKMFGTPPPNGQTAPPRQQNPGVKAPAVSAASTGRTQVLLGQTSQQVAGKLTETADEYYEVESWPAPSVAGFEEVEDFYSKLARTYGLNNSSSDPAAASGAAALKAYGDLWMAMELTAAKAQAGAPAMARVISDICGRESAAKGLPMLQTLRMVKMMTPEQQARMTRGGPPAASAAPPVPGSTGSGTSVKSAITALEFTFRVTSYSAEHLDESLFQIPSGYLASEPSKRDTWPAAILP